MIDPDFESIVAVLIGGARGDHDDRNMLQLGIGADVAGQVEAIHARHFDIDQQNVGNDIKHLLQSIDAVLGGQDLIAVA